ncbi:hypothetical protein SISNIDRAFT_458521 [Sistotremastrum niveocremeum HHB9708]|uniref:Cyclase n=2 Tax=Sistotremastraceae TaxID=3402574 RepID=A0A164QPI3_9AGAM|nr:hypothetical protein SISNIDRAFT_458521 [Sistotremastrum niveocremeum HHB9708]KZT37225.1 hypothetical protein SISSUDRAFT_1048769 [Sistotremastrum suecicum HHB10207 ss-3]
MARNAQSPATTLANAAKVHARLPTFDELPKFRNFTGCAWQVWGSDDQLGTINLLTPDVVQRAAKEEIRTGKSVALNWPINFPSKPLFGRQPPEIKILDRGFARDDEIHLNTQSGTQWDGLRHFGINAHGVIYNNHPISAIKTGEACVMDDPTKIDPDLIKFGIHNWARHGISGRGVLLDLVRYYTESGDELPYSPWETHGFTVPELERVAEKQGVEFQQGDILLIRAGFIQKYYQSSQSEKDWIGRELGTECFAGVEQSEAMKRFLWDNHFAAVASDQPGFEKLPPNQGDEMLHQTLLGLWGMPIGELFDLEELSEQCAATGRYAFFFASWPLNILGGCASPANAAAYF